MEPKWHRFSVRHRKRTKYQMQNYDTCGTALCLVSGVHQTREMLPGKGHGTAHCYRDVCVRQRICSCNALSAPCHPTADCSSTISKTLRTYGQPCVVYVRGRTASIQVQSTIHTAPLTCNLLNLARAISSSSISTPAP